MIIFTKKSIYIVQNIAYMIIHTPNPISLTQTKKPTFSSFVVFPTTRCVFLTGIIPHHSNPVLFFFIFTQAVTKSQTTGQLLNYSSRLSVRQAVHKSSAGQITGLKDVLSLTRLSSSKASQCLQQLIKMNSGQWKSIEKNGNQSNLTKQRQVTFIRALVHLNAYSRWYGFRHSILGMDLEMFQGNQRCMKFYGGHKHCLLCFISYLSWSGF